MNVPTPPSLDYVFTIDAHISAPRSAGTSQLGERLHIPITGGRVFGPKLNGRILPGGSDWPVIGPDGSSRIEAHYSIEADDGSLIYVVNKGLRVSSSEVRQRLRSGETVPADKFYMRAAPVFDAPDGQHRWLCESLFVCKIAPSGSKVQIDVFRVA